MQDSEPLLFVDAPPDDSNTESDADSTDSESSEYSGLSEDDDSEEDSDLSDLSDTVCAYPTVFDPVYKLP